MRFEHVMLILVGFLHLKKKSKLIHQKIYVLGMWSYSYRKEGDRSLPITPLYLVFLSPGNLEEEFFSVPPPYLQGPQDERFWRAEREGWRSPPPPDICMHSQREELPARAGSMALPL